MAKSRCSDVLVSGSISVKHRTTPLALTFPGTCACVWKMCVAGCALWTMARIQDSREECCVGR
jgi:hypothetical protein